MSTSRPAGPRFAVDRPALQVVATASGCGSWADLAGAAQGCVACPELAATRTTVVVGDAPAGARLVLVGEAPGAEEDRTGRPFVGKAGQLLDRVLAEAGLDRGAVAVVNVLQCRPPGNRTPTTTEAVRCRGWLDRKLALVEPALVVTLGLSAAVAFLGRGIRLGAVRGTVHEVDGRRVLPTYHPSAAIRFGPNGAPLAALREDLKTAAGLLT
ncbi:MAG TPA: uracil-DNA glycosylase [Mycobacteriales bacterium]